MGVDLWKADQWNKELISNQVLVMTPQILVNLLNHGFMTLNKINLMIFDECHAATGQSPYCSIMCRYKDFKEKPRILGLTASVIAGKCSPLNVTKKMKDLEKTLYSRIQTASNISEVNRYATKPREVIIEFRSDDPSNNDVKAEFLGVLKVGYQHIEALTPKKTKTNDSSLVETFADILKWFQKMDTSDDNDTCDSLDFSCTPLEMLKSISDILRILGLWCANCMIDKYLEDIDNQIPEAIVDHNVLFQHSLEICQNALQKAKTIYLNHSSHFSERKKLELVTPKMEKLRELLQTLGQHIDRNRNVTEFRGIIFVERRVVAWILTQYLEKLSEVRPLTFGYLHSCYVVGHGSVMCNINAYCMNSQKQDTMLSAFRSGVKNLLIATQVVEEGLDIPKCNVVIRFDLPKNYCSYVQSMGRARAEGALYIMLVPSGECFTLQQDIVVFKIIESVSILM